MTRRRFSPVLNDCGYCVLEGPDEFGNYELVESPECPVHGWVREEQPERRVEEDSEPPVCYLGHVDCYDMHHAERRADEADWEQEREDGWGEAA